ncbi:hypothetical protein QBZ16_000749 [Prototheca wickerhamii]|uniref:WDHD1 first WD40 domain-containing protein n=1 Tax=Prototheca wickerhamii TaxID=3111 RepID=A0AAD9MMA9_PROWI|nr:hypothetical protein QBZ16_000749 [Prototheca wickerhamii]
MGRAYSLPKLAPSRVITKSTLPVRCLAISPCGAKLAVGGDDAGVKLIELESATALRSLGSQPYTRGLAFDPEGRYLASLAADGSLSVHDLHTGKPVLQRRGTGPKLDVLGAALATPAWHPDGGSLLAVPGRDGEVSLFERLSWRLVEALPTGLGADLRALAYSPNGVYLAASDADGGVAVCQGAEVLARRVVPDAIQSLSWAPQADRLAVCAASEGVALWTAVIGPELLPPYADPDTAPVAPGTIGLLWFELLSRG